ncbi:hypothetical protein PROFUN_06935 [Planoprotostelium fungivorum]|uniref:Aquaporin n=1 Tax=Planoprotostelium fungivorum TaxID=1890364 RepID=A0A2P6NMY3_9EUKA|nr:hypothetical protein PROFUN_06935 [Planoprotostelium fungivorum]
MSVCSFYTKPFLITLLVLLKYEASRWAKEPILTSFLSTFSQSFSRRSVLARQLPVLQTVQNGAPKASGYWDSNGHRDDKPILEAPLRQAYGSTPTRTGASMTKNPSAHNFDNRPPSSRITFVAPRNDDIVELESRSSSSHNVHHMDVHVNQDKKRKEFSPPHHKPYGFVRAIQRLRDKAHLRPLFVEAVGSFWFIFVLIQGLGGYVFGTILQPLAKVPALGDWTATLLSLALSVSYGVFMSLPISGGHLSPAMTITLAVWRGFPWKAVPLYLLAQFAGAIFAAICFYGIQAPMIDLLDPSRTHATGALFVNSPSAMWSSGHLIANEFLGSTIFVFMVAALTDLKHPLASIKAAPFIVGSAVFVIANIFGWTTFVLNPFKDFGPRVYLTAYYKGLWSNPYWAIALFVPILGHMTGMFLYDVMVSKDYEDDEE